MNSIGIVSAAGVGRALAEWIENKGPTMDLKLVDIKRFCHHHNNKTYLRDTVREIIDYCYKLPYPLSEVQQVRAVKCSPLHDLLDGQGSSWCNVMGWERPSWFSRDGTGTSVAADKRLKAVTFVSVTDNYTNKSVLAWTLGFDL